MGKQKGQKVAKGTKKVAQHLSMDGSLLEQGKYETNEK